MKKQLFSLVLAFAFGFAPLAAEVTTDYYSSIDNTSGDALFNAVSTVAGTGYKSIGYDGLYDAYKQTDDKNGYVWDMYSDCTWEHGQKKCGDYKVECDCYNREHSIPQSWWGKGTTDQGCDIFHVLPTDGKVNGMRSNNPYGEVSSATYTSGNGSKLGSSALSSYSGTVFEPIDEYKGDIARGILGTMVKWKGSWTKSEGANVFTGTYTAAGNYGLTAYSVELFLKWHRQDPVSQKEIDRNNGIQATQGNRNPFIDYPYLVEYIWGKKAGETVSMSNLIASFESDFEPGVSDGWRDETSTDPRITVSSKSVAFGAVEINSQNTQAITVKGSNLTDNISLAISGTNAGMFSLSNNSVSAGEEVTIIYTPTAEGTHTATLTLTSSGATSVEVTLTGSGAKKYTVTFDAGAGSCGTSSLTESSVGEGITLPTATAPSTCSDYTFAGWATTQVSETTTAPTLYAALATYNPTSNCTLYAVYQKGGSNTKVTELNAGDVVVIYYPTDKMALTATASGTALSGVATTVEGNSITSLGSGAVKLIVETEGDNFRLRNGNSYLICPSTGNGASFSTETTYADWTFEDQSGINCIKNVNAKFTKNSTDYSQYLEYYKGFTTFSFNSSNSSQYQFEFYKYEDLEDPIYTSAPDCANCTATNASFANSTIEKLTTDAAFTNAFSSDNTSTVEFASSNTGVATVDANGQVTIVGMGTTTITATQADDGTHCAVAKDYKLTVTQPAIGDLQVTSTTNNGFCIEWNNIGNTTYTIDIMSGNSGSKDTTFFENTLTSDQGDFTINNASMDGSITYVWKYNSSYTCMVASAYVNKTSYAADSWLISPAIDLSEAASAIVTFEHAARYQNGNVNEEFLLMVAKNPSETLDDTEWAQLTIPTMPTADAWDFASSGEIDLSNYLGEKNVRIALRYVSTASAADSWRVKNVKVSGTKYAPASISGYPQELTNETSHCATGLTANTSYTCVVTTAEGNNTNTIEITTRVTPVTTYNINISNPTTGGKATASATTAAEGDVITLTATPAAGYELTGWNAVDNTTNTVTVSNNQFTMPASDVAVSPQFAKIDYTITTNLTHVAASSDNATTTQIGTALGLNFKANQGYTLPDGITVKVGTTTLESSQYAWNQSSGQFTLGLSETLLGNIEISITANAQMFTIIFKNEDGTELQTSQVAYGETPVYSGATPTKESTAQYNYTFSGWNPAITPVTREATYTAQFTETLRTYYVLFADYDGTTLKEQDVEYGSSAVAPANPERGYYTFTGWSEDFSNITGDLLVTAQYKAIVYTITANLSNVTAASSNPTSATIEDKELSFTFTAASGYELPNAITVSMGETTLANETHYLWDKSEGSLEIILTNSGIQGNTIITIAATAKSYGVILDKNEHGTENGLVYIYYLGDIDEDNCMWIEPSEEKYALNGYFTEANGGTKVIDANGKLVAGVAGYTDSDGLWQHIGNDVTLYAQWSVKTYTVNFVDYDGTTLSSQTIEYGSSAVAPANPQRTGYTFTGWNADFSNVTSDLTITAVYEENKPTAVTATTLAEPICHTTNSMLYVSNLQAGSHLALYDAAGRLIAQHRHCNETEHFLLPNGIYIIKIEANGQTLQIKAVK